MLILANVESGEGLDRKGYYGVMSQPLSGADPQVFNTITLTEVPFPAVEKTTDGMRLDFTFASENAPVIGTNIIGVNIYSSLDGTTFSKLNDTPVIGGTFVDGNPRDVRYYSVALAFRSALSSPLSRPIRRPYITGDLDDNGVVELKDSLLALKVLAGSEEVITPETFLTPEGRVGIGDAINILIKVSD